MPGTKTPTLQRLVGTARERWRVEQDYRELEEELGLDHFVGRSWPGWHHHVNQLWIGSALTKLLPDGEVDVRVGVRTSDNVKMTDTAWFTAAHRAIEGGNRLFNRARDLRGSGLPG